MNLRQIYAVQEKYRQKIKAVCPMATEHSGIYILTREKDGFRFAYVGQAKHMLTRLAQHLEGYSQHIDRSLKKRGLFSAENPDGWKIQVHGCLESELDEKERYYIKLYANAAFQLYNATIGGQDSGKAGLKETVRKGYNEGVRNGYEKARKEIAHLFGLHLDFDVKKPGNKVQEKAKAKFEKFIAAQQKE